MTSPLSTDDGDDGNDFDSLEERIVYTERDKEREVRTTVRVSRRQERLVEKIQIELGTNKIEVLTRAYNAGLSKLREIEFKERSDDLLRLSVAMSDLVADSREYDLLIGNDFHRIDNYEITVEENYDRLVESPVEVYVKDSVISEVKDRLMGRMMIKPGIHRPIICLGLSTSQHAGDVFVGDAKTLLDSFDESLRESRKKQEELIIKSMPKLHNHAVDNGIGKESIDVLRNVEEMMITDYRQSFSRQVDMIEEDADVG
jgi:hypothetical protein